MGPVGISHFVRPTAFLRMLEKKVVGQKEMKTKLAYAFSHYTGFLDDPQVGRPIPLLYGPTGAGKTYAIELCCEMAELPLTTLGGGGISPAGYKGVTLRDLVSQHFHRHETSQGVIFLDEIDKWCRGAFLQYEKADPEVVGNNLSKQAEALRYLEGEDIDFIEEGKDIKDLENIVFHTQDTFWIFAGAFVGLDNLVKSRTGQEQISSEEIWENAEPPDFIRYGMIEEFTNRITSWAWVKALTAHQIMTILETQDKPKWIAAFKLLNCELELDGSALAAAANVAVQNRRGPRGAKMYLNRTMGDVYTEADEYELSRVTVDGAVLMHGRLMLDAVHST